MKTLVLKNLLIVFIVLSSLRTKRDFVFRQFKFSQDSYLVSQTN